MENSSRTQPLSTPSGDVDDLIFRDQEYRVSQR